MDSLKKSKQKLCANCSALGADLLRCTGCSQVHYCSKTCQKEHWPQHKKKCREAAAACQLQKQISDALQKDTRCTQAASSTVECPICLEEMSSETIELPCSHAFHSACVKSLREHGVNDACPMCRAPLPPGAEDSFERAVRLLVRMEHQSSDQLQHQTLAEAEALLEDALRQDPDHSKANCCLAYVLGRKSGRNQDAAIAAYRKAIVANDDNSKGVPLAETLHELTGQPSMLAYPDSVQFTIEETTSALQFLSILSDQKILPHKRMQLLGSLLDKNSFVAAAERQTPSLWVVVASLFKEEAELFEERIRTGPALVSMTQHLLGALLHGETSKRGRQSCACECRAAALFATPGALQALLGAMKATIRACHSSTPTLVPVMNNIARDQLRWLTLALAFESVGRAAVLCTTGAVTELTRVLTGLFMLAKDQESDVGPTSATEALVYLVVAMMDHWSTKFAEKPIADEVEMTANELAMYQDVALPLALASIAKKRVLSNGETGMVLSSTPLQNGGSGAGRSRPNKKKGKGKKNRRPTR
jgi:hypothetical protein